MNAPDAPSPDAPVSGSHVADPPTTRLLDEHAAVVAELVGVVPPLLLAHLSRQHASLMTVAGGRIGARRIADGVVLGPYIVGEYDGARHSYAVTTRRAPRVASVPARHRMARTRYERR